VRTGDVGTQLRPTPTESREAAQGRGRPNRGRRPLPPALPMGALTLHRAVVASPWWWAIAVVAVLANVLLTAFVGLTAVAPAFAFDEVHLLEVSRFFVGLELPRVRGAGYYPGWAVLFAPAWWVSSDPDVVYRIAAVIGWLIAAGTMVPLTFIARRFRLSTPQALTAAAIVSSLPARSVQADYVLSERALFFFVVLAALAAFRLWERPTVLRSLLFASAIGVVYLTHVRMLPFVLASAIWILALTLKHWRAAVSGLAVLALVAFLAGRVGDRINSIALQSSAAQSESVIAKIEALRPGLFLRAALGQTWNQLVGSYGLIAIGIVAVVFLTWKEIRRFRMGRATWLFGTFAATWILSVLAWAGDWSLFGNPWRRLDAWVYGRYVDPVAALVILVGLAVVIRGVSHRAWLAGLVTALAVVVPTVLWVAREAPTWGYVTPAHIAGVLPWGWLLPKESFPPGMLPTFTNENRFWLIASLSALACLLCYRLLRHAGAAIAVGAVGLAVMGSLGANASSDKFRASQHLEDAVVAPVQALLDRDPSMTMAWDTACNRRGFTSGVGQNMIGWEFVDQTILGSIRSDEVIPDEDVIFSCVGTSQLAEHGALPIANVEIYESWLWVMPGSLQDQLATEGLLVSREN
jgi:hypothetical protein